MPNSHFQPAPIGLDSEQTSAYQERARHADNAVAIVSSNGTTPSPESLALMQRHVNGELSIEQTIELTDAMLKARYAPPVPEPPAMSVSDSLTAFLGQLSSPAFQQANRRKLRDEAAAANTFLPYDDEQGRYVYEYPATGEIFQASADRQTMTLLSVHGVPVAPDAAPVVIEARAQRPAAHVA
jgi:hypothetical protein